MDVEEGFGRTWDHRYHFDPGGWDSEGSGNLRVYVPGTETGEWGFRQRPGRLGYPQGPVSRVRGDERRDPEGWKGPQRCKGDHPEYTQTQKRNL